MILDAPLYVLNTVIWRDLLIPAVKEEVCCYSSQYSARLSAHPDLMDIRQQAIAKTPAK
jgi:hypothetical protein